MPTLRLDGRSAAYLDQGSGDPPLVLVHGYTGAKEDWAPVLGALAEDRRVVALDLPGHGDSEGLDDPDAYGLAATAQWVLRVVGWLGLGDVHLLGHSMGGLVAQRVALAASQRLRSLVLMATGLGALREEVGDRLTQVAAVAREQGLEAAFELSQRLMAAVEFDPQTRLEREARVEELRARYLRLAPAAVVGGANNLVTALPLEAFLRGIDIPVLVVHGDKDYAWTPAEQRLLWRTVNGAQLAVVPDAYHSPQWDNPRAWLEAVRGFLAWVDGRDA
jgi:pimeloyl-ACP methyl ester carboxylesterase